MNGEAQALSVAATILVVLLAGVATGFALFILWAMLRERFKKWFGAIVLILIPVTVSAPSSPRGAEAYGGSAAVSLAWQGSDSAEGYRIYYREIGQNYTQYQDCGTNTSWRVIGLKRKTTYWFVATAYLGSYESGRSNEVFYRTASAPSYR